MIDMKAVPPVVIDGIAWVAIGVFGTWIAIFSTEEATKLIPSLPLFIIKAFGQMQFAGWSSLKMFRSTAYADHVKKVNGGHTDFFGRLTPPEPPKP